MFPNSGERAPGIVRTSEILAITGLARYHLICIRGGRLSLLSAPVQHKYACLRKRTPACASAERCIPLPRNVFPSPLVLATLSEREKARATKRSSGQKHRSGRIYMSRLRERPTRSPNVNRLEMSLLSRVVPREKFADETRRRHKMGCMSTPLCPVAAVRCRLMASRCLSARLRSVSLSLSLSHRVCELCQTRREIDLREGEMDLRKKNLNLFTHHSGE